MNDFDRDKMDQIADAERWLAGFPTPPPSPEVLHRIKQAVRREAAAIGDAGGRRHWAPWHGAAASAAMILLAVAVGWYSTRLPIGSTAAFEDRVESLAIAEEIEASLSWLATMDEDFLDLEAFASDEAWTLSGTALYEAFEDATSAEPELDLEDAGTRLFGPFEIPNAEEV